MDDSIEQPGNVLAKDIVNEQNEEAEQSSDEEDGGPDWTKLPYVAYSHILNDSSLQGSLHVDRHRL